MWSTRIETDVRRQSDAPCQLMTSTAWQRSKITSGQYIGTWSSCHSNHVVHWQWNVTRLSQGLSRQSSILSLISKQQQQQQQRQHRWSNQLQDRWMIVLQCDSFRNPSTDDAVVYDVERLHSMRVFDLYTNQPNSEMLSRFTTVRCG
jgi:hypothetical protein